MVTNSYYRWDGTIREFGIGTLEANFPIRAAAFSRKVGLPPRLYNDLAAGGYLTWEPPVEGGVFVDGRLEVYDADFLSVYMSTLADPQAWQRQIDRYGINTVLLFHRWENRHPMIRALTRVPEWTLVYHDEVAAVFVRSEGNEPALERAREVFPAWREETLAALRARPSRWQWPIERITALSSYAALLDMIGETDSAVELYRELLAYRLPPRNEGVARIHVGLHLARRGELGPALEHLERAAGLDPSNDAVRGVIRKIRDWQAGQ